MIRLGSSPSDMREMDGHDIFISRLKLLVLMARAYLNGCPLGEHRKKAIKSTAEKVLNESVDWGGCFSNFRSSSELGELMGLDHVFYQRVKLLSLMARSIADEYPIGYHRQVAIRDNVEKICETISFTNNATDLMFFKIA